jgi:polynucleotide 5'-hydroxyl-kinase GRC3/NOL9
MFIRGGKRMNLTVEGGKTLLVDGPASVLVVSGRVDAFGFSVKDASRVVIREGKRLPFAALETTNFELSLGENASVEEIDGTAIPQSWIDSFEMIRAFQKKPIIAMVLGKVDSGKTSFCTYLINMLIGGKQKVAILDGDLGQTDIGPPCTVAYALVAKPVTDLFELKAENAFFVGVTSPSEAVNRMIGGVALMKAEVLGKAADFVVVNTDGWVEGREAVEYKSWLVEELNPDVVLCVQQKDELAPLLVALEKFRKTTIESPLNAKQRSREKRRNLRELGYSKYLTDAKVKSLPLELLATEEQRAVLIMRGEGRGLLLGLYDSQRKFLGISVLREVNYSRRTLKVFTPVSKKPSSIVLGRVRLDESLKEIPLISEETGDAAS